MVSPLSKPVTGLGSQAEVTNDMALRATALLNWMMVLKALARLTLIAQSQYARPSRWLSRPFIPKRKHKYSVQVIYLLANTKFRSGSSYSVGFRARFVLHASLSRSLQPMLHAARDCTTDPQQRLCCAIGPDGATPSRPRKWALCDCKQPLAVHCVFSAAHKMRAQCGLVARLPTKARLLDRYKLLACA